MKKLHLWALALAATAFACGRKNDDLSATKIVGGALGARSHPGTVEVDLYNGNDSPSLCTGAFIRHDLLMTAGHCFKEFPVTSVGFSAEAGYFKTHRAYSSDWVVHPDFKMQGNYFAQLASDIAFARFPAHTAPDELVVKIATAMPKTNDPVYLAGYGRTDPDDWRSAWTRSEGSNTVNNIWPEHAHAIVLIRSATYKGSDNAATGNGDSGGALYNAAGEAVGIVHGGDVEGNNTISHYVNLNDPQIARFIEQVLSR